MQDNAILKLFEEKKKRGDYVSIAAPMVRVSKLPYRMLVRHYHTDVAYTPMICADSFYASHASRVAEFSTCRQDRPLIVQFAARNAIELANASQLVVGYADAVGINCGCPQAWAIRTGYGCGLLGPDPGPEEKEEGDHPLSAAPGPDPAPGDVASSRPKRGLQGAELIADMVQQTRRATNDRIAIEAKIRVFSDLRRTVDAVRQIEAAGVSWISVHGRTRHMRPREPVHWEAVKLVKDTVSVPVVHNGDVFSAADAAAFAQKTGVEGIMAARGLQSNPGLFAGFEACPRSILREFLELSIHFGVQKYEHFHGSIQDLIDPVLSPEDRRVFVATHSTPALISFLRQRDLLDDEPLTPKDTAIRICNSKYDAARLLAEDSKRLLVYQPRCRTPPLTVFEGTTTDS
eukprot:ANDGO_00711.mRNA.1 putative tRNA-dihydrouridine synthase-like protein C45G9.2